MWVKFSDERRLNTALAVRRSHPESTALQPRTQACDLAPKAVELAYGYATTELFWHGIGLECFSGISSYHLGVHLKISSLPVFESYLEIVTILLPRHVLAECAGRCVGVCV